MPATHAASVCIGRFQPFHFGHLRLLTRALALAPRCVVVLGSSFQARTPRHPWTWQERAEMIRLAVPEAQRGCLDFLPLRDQYDDATWTAAVRRGVASLMGHGPDADIVLVGHPKDAASACLHGFPGWRSHRVERSGPVNAEPLRDALFASAPAHIDAGLAALVDQLPRGTIDVLRAWSALPCVPRLAEDWRAMVRYHAAWARMPFPTTLVTVDAVVTCAGHALLIRRGQAPGKGLLAMPGGFIDARETACQSAMRELREETGLGLPDSALREGLRAVAVFDQPERSQRGRTITHVHHFALSRSDLPAIQAADDALAADWVPIDRLTSLEDQFHDDHFQMLDHFLGLTAENASTEHLGEHPPGHGERE